MRNIERRILWQFLDTMSTAIAAAADELHATIEEEPEEGGGGGDEEDGEPEPVPGRTVTERGFAQWEGVGKSCCHLEGGFDLRESSSISAHPHLWLFIRGECIEHLGKHQRPAAHMSPATVRNVRDALTAWLVEIGEEKDFALKPCAPGTCSMPECGKADRTPEEQAAFEAAIPGYLERSGLAAMACNDGCPEKVPEDFGPGPEELEEIKRELADRQALREAGHECVDDGEITGMDCSGCAREIAEAEEAAFHVPAAAPPSVDIWDAINDYVIACGGDPGPATIGGPRMDAVVKVEAEIRKLTAPEPYLEIRNANPLQAARDETVIPPYPACYWCGGTATERDWHLKAGDGAGSIWLRLCAACVIKAAGDRRLIGRRGVDGKARNVRCGACGEPRMIVSGSLVDGQVDGLGFVCEQCAKEADDWAEVRFGEEPREGPPPPKPRERTYGGVDPVEVEMVTIAGARLGSVTIREPEPAPKVTQSTILDAIEDIRHRVLRRWGNDGPPHVLDVLDQAERAEKASFEGVALAEVERSVDRGRRRLEKLEREGVELVVRGSEDAVHGVAATEAARAGEKVDVTIPAEAFFAKPAAREFLDAARETLEAADPLMHVSGPSAEVAAASAYAAAKERLHSAIAEGLAPPKSEADE